MAKKVKRSHGKLPKSALSLLALLVSMLPAADVRGQVPGERPPANIVRLAQPALDGGRRALETEDHVAVRAAVVKAIAVLGPWAGNPETMELSKVLTSEQMDKLQKLSEERRLKFEKIVKP